MRIIIIEPGQAPLIERALSHMIKGLMLDRANRGALEDREAATAAVDQAIALKRHIGEIEDGGGGTLIVGGSLSFPGLVQIDQACDELFGLDCTPKLLRDAVTAHTATLAVMVAAAMHAGKHMKGVMDAAEALLEELGEGSAVNVREEAADLRRSLDVIEATIAAEQFTTEDMDAAVAEARNIMPGLASWVACVLASWEARQTVEGQA